MLSFLLASYAFLSIAQKVTYCAYAQYYAHIANYWNFATIHIKFYYYTGIVMQAPACYLSIYSYHIMLCIALIISYYLICYAQIIIILIILL